MGDYGLRGVPAAARVVVEGVEDVVERPSMIGVLSQAHCVIAGGEWVVVWKRARRQITQAGG